MKKTRSAAIKAGDRYYKTGKACKRGHISKRQTVDASCLQCRYDAQKAERARIQSLISNKE